MVMDSDDVVKLLVGIDSEFRIEFEIVLVPDVVLQLRLALELKISTHWKTWPSRGGIISQ